MLSYLQESASLLKLVTGLRNFPDEHVPLSLREQVDRFNGDIWRLCRICSLSGLLYNFSSLGLLGGNAVIKSEEIYMASFDN